MSPASIRYAVALMIAVTGSAVGVLTTATGGARPGAWVVAVRVLRAGVY